MKKLKVIKKDVGVVCFCCSGKGCKKCNKGKYEESHYIFIVGNLAIDADTLK
jgi:hypothetical protein